MEPGVGVVSPHLDDAVLSLGLLLYSRPGSLVVTVFDGGPATVDPITWWDATSGFAAGDDVVGTRHDEDAEALAILGASGAHLGFWDHQYRDPAYGYDGPPPDALEAEVVDALDAAVADSGLATWALPLGLLHPDHRLANWGALGVVRRRPELVWLVYEELPYFDQFPDAVAPAVADLLDQGFELGGGLGGGGAGDADVDTGPAAGGLKERAIRRYATQCLALGPERVAAAIGLPERRHPLRFRPRSL